MLHALLHLDMCLYVNSEKYIIYHASKQVRIMKGKDSSENKGYAFVTFRTKELASKAIKELNNTQLKVKQADHYFFFFFALLEW